MTTTDGWLKLIFAKCVTRKTRSLGELVLCSICIVPERDQKKKSVTAGLHDDPDRLVVVKKRGCDWGACGRPRRRETGLSKQGCDWGACGRPRRDVTCHLASKALPPRSRCATAAEEADSHAGTALAAEGCRWAQASQRNEA